VQAVTKIGEIVQFKLPFVPAFGDGPGSGVGPGCGVGLGFGIVVVVESCPEVVVESVVEVVTSSQYQIGQLKWGRYCTSHLQFKPIHIFN
jgi:hypothetical protein